MFRVSGFRASSNSDGSTPRNTPSSNRPEYGNGSCRTSTSPPVWFEDTMHFLGGCGYWLHYVPMLPCWDSSYQDALHAAKDVI